MRESATQNTPLPPSVEKAYHTKCKELKHRLTEIEEANDAARQRKQRIERSILKMRLERAFLLERLQKVQLKGSGVEVADSDRSVSPPLPAAPPPPPTLPSQERAPRGRRAKSPPLEAAAHQQYAVGIPISPTGPIAPPTHQQIAPSGNGINGPPIHGHHVEYTAPPLASQPPPGYPANAAFGPSAYPQHPGMIPKHPYLGPPIDRRAPSEIPTNEQLPLIHTLPNGTNVVIINGAPKQPPWTIRDVEPRHHLRAKFEQMPFNAQMDYVMTGGYTPYDVHGNPVVLHQTNDPHNPDAPSHIKHVFRDDPHWDNPVQDNVRQDDPWRRREQQEAAALAARRNGHSSHREGGGSGSRRSGGGETGSSSRRAAERAGGEHGERPHRERSAREGGGRRSGSTRRSGGEHGHGHGHGQSGHSQGGGAIAAGESSAAPTPGSIPSASAVPVTSNPSASVSAPATVPSGASDVGPVPPQHRDNANAANPATGANSPSALDSSATPATSHTQPHTVAPASAAGPGVPVASSVTGDSRAVGLVDGAAERGEKRGRDGEVSVNGAGDGSEPRAVSGGGGGGGFTAVNR